LSHVGPCCGRRRRRRHRCHLDLTTFGIAQNIHHHHHRRRLGHFMEYHLPFQMNFISPRRQSVRPYHVPQLRILHRWFQLLLMIGSFDYWRIVPVPVHHNISI